MFKHILILFFFILISCSSKTEFEDVSVQLPNYLSSSYYIDFKTNHKDSVEVSYWENSEDELLSLSKYGDSFNIPLPFLKSSKDYKFKISSSNSSSIIYTFKTNNLPDFFPKFELEKDPEFSFDGYLFFRTQTNPGIQFILDKNADVVWYNVSDTILSRPFNKTKKPIFFKNASYISLSKKNLIHEHSYHGDTLITISTKKNDIHHDIMKIEDKNNNNIKYVALSYQYLFYNKNNIDSLIGDGIVAYDISGNELWNWNIFDHVDPSEEEYNIQEDWSHANAIDVDYDGNYLVSFRSFNQIWKIDSESGNIIWRLGLNGDFKLENDEIFYQQHAINKIDSSKYLLFDNGSADIRSSSRALIFELDEKNKSFKLDKSIFLPDSLFTFKQGSVYQIDEENYLFTSSVNNKTIISDSSGKILWTLSSDHSYYRVYYLQKNRWDI